MQRFDNQTISDFIDKDTSNHMSLSSESENIYIIDILNLDFLTQYIIYSQSLISSIKIFMLLLDWYY